MKRFIVILLSIIVLLSGCSVKQGQLVVIEDGNQNENRQNKSIFEHLNVESRKFPMEKYREAVSMVDKSMKPLAVSPDFSMVLAFRATGNPVSDTFNRRVLIGNMVQEIELYAITAETRESKSLGKFPSLKDFRFDETGKSLAFIDGNSNIYIYNSISRQLQKLVTAEKWNAYNTLSWSKDSKSLMINCRMEFDISSREFISIAVDSYTPFIKSKFVESSYIVQMKNNEYNDMIAFYDFNSKSFTSIAEGIYSDCDGSNVLYTKEYMSGLNIVSLKTLESKSIDTGPIYCSYIMKSTGDILYSTLNNNLDDNTRYLLIKVNPNTMQRISIKLGSPTFYMSPAEDKLYVISGYSENAIEVDTENLKISQNDLVSDDPDIYGIKTTLLKMLQLDYSFIDTYEKYENKAKEIYKNTYDPLPQEALENKLVDFTRFNMPIPTSQREDHLPAAIFFDQLNIAGNKASVNLGLYYINSIEMVKEGENWYITGFSTHPASAEAAAIFSIVKKHLSDIKNKNIGEAVKHWVAKEDNDYRAAQRKIVEELIKDADNLTFEIGEIELWSMSDPHRAESPDRSTYAKVKILITEGNNTVKYKLILSRQYKQQYAIDSWNTDPLSISQLF
ncbi:MAG TPA: hypothetical protein PLL98_08440 [Bacillota bacterium]|nr:hypothetical protein [Bacillota bacterium]HPL53720.1 hypothetical protein [Bacillota bacterium]